MKITSRYGEEKRALESYRKKRKRWITLALFSTLIAILISAFIYQVNIYADTVIAECPPDTWDKKCGHLVVEKDITKFEKHSPEWWNAYCNSVLGTKDECK